MRALPALVVALPMLFMAGCLSEPARVVPSTHDDGDMHGHMDMPTTFTMTGTNCEEGGFVAAYPGSTKYAGTWESADIKEEIGNPIHDSLMTPVVGTLYGNWHMGYRCASATHDGETVKDFIFGRVSQMIKAPAWDMGGADQHFILTGFALGNGTFADDLREVTTADVSHAYNTQVTWYLPKELPRSAAYALFCDAEKGVYEGIGDIQYYREFPARTIRLWWTVPADGSESHLAHDHADGVAGQATPKAPGEQKYNPVYWDITTTGGAQYTTPPSGVQFGFHNRGVEGMMEHGVPTQPTLTNIYEHKSLTVTYGHVFTDVTIDQVWVH